MPLMQLKPPQIVGACVIGRAAKKRRKVLDVTDVIRDASSQLNCVLPWRPAYAGATGWWA